MRDDNPSTSLPKMSIEVADVDEVHACAIERGLQIVYPLTDEPWGIRLFLWSIPTELSSTYPLPFNADSRSERRYPVGCGI
jgi:hypothetical protein